MFSVIVVERMVFFWCSAQGGHKRNVMKDPAQVEKDAQAGLEAAF